MLTFNTSESATNYVNNNWSCPRATFIQKHFLARGAHLLLTPTSFLTSAIDTVAGSVFGILAIGSFGCSPTAYSLAGAQLAYSSKLLALPYRNFLKAINPDAKFGDMKQPFFMSKILVEPLISFAGRCMGSQYLFKKHVVSRLTYALAVVACLVTRAVQVVIGIPVVPISILVAVISVLTAGRFESLLNANNVKAINTLAYKTLEAPAIIADLFQCTIRFINPWVDESLKKNQQQSVR